MVLIVKWAGETHILDKPKMFAISETVLITTFKPINFSHARSRFPLFLPIVSHIHVPAHGKDNYKQTAARRPRAGCMSISVLLQLRQHVASQCFSCLFVLLLFFFIIK